MKTAIELQSELLKEMAERIFLAANAADSNWVEAYFDYRLDTPDCGIGRAILRTELSRRDFDPPMEVSQALDCLLELRDKVPGGGWFGLFIHVTRNGSVDVRYDHNYDCIDSFSDDIKSQNPF